MKKISIDNDDYSFENRYKFKNLVSKIKALGISLVKNGREICISGSMIGWVIFSISVTIDWTQSIQQSLHSVKVMAEADQDSKEVLTDEYQALLSNNAIIVLEKDVSCDKEFYFENECLYDKNGNIITLDNLDNSLFFISCKISSDTFSNINLANSNCKTLSLQNSAVDNGFIEYLPETLEMLSLNKCNYINNLERLGEKCPNIKFLDLNNTSALDNFDFLYKLPNLKYVSFGDCTYATEELLDYLNRNNITTDLTEEDIAISKELNAISSEIVSPEMSEAEKIKVVCEFVVDTIEYDIDKGSESNDNPISCILEDGQGVCISYARLMNELLHRAEINSYVIFNDDHAWNLVEKDEKFYYIDTTNMDAFYFYKLMLKYFNISGYYLTDTDTTFLSSMSSPSDIETLIPESLVKKIEESNFDNSILEKCGSVAGNLGAYLFYILAGLSVSYIKVPFSHLYSEIPCLIKNIKNDYDNKLVFQKKRK